MHLVKWKFKALEISMMKVDGELYFTSGSLCAALGMTVNQLRKVVQASKGELQAMVVSKRHDRLELIEFLMSRSKQLGINDSQSHSTLRLWSLDQALKVAYLARTDVSWEFIEASIALVKAEATSGYVSKAEFLTLEQRYSETLSRVDRMEDIVLRPGQA